MSLFLGNIEDQEYKEIVNMLPAQMLPPSLDECIVAIHRRANNIMLGQKQRCDQYNIGRRVWRCKHDDYNSTSSDDELDDDNKMDAFVRECRRLNSSRKLQHKIHH